MRFAAERLMNELPLVLAGQSVNPVIVTDDDDDSSIPAELRNWLVRLRLLEGVPFANLVADTELLPEESIRWFYVDRRWTDALVQGALSVGTVNTDDRTQLTAGYPAIRAELDEEERNLRRVAGSDRYRSAAGQATGPISGFILRSRAVSGWPAMHVRAFSIEPAGGDDAKIKEDEPGRMRLLRLERLAPAVLLCLFDGIPTVVHLEEPRQGVQFGFDAAPSAAGQSAAELDARDRATFEYLPNQTIPVPFRRGSNGVVDIQALERSLAIIPETGAGDGLDSGEYALQLVRFPYRQIWGDPVEDPIRVVFRPTVMYQELVAQLFEVEP